ncbi:GNAT family N-acetyltransferase [Trujillonella humicola]|uniref:GNAT family N-acetyltransferase n=1 Tax=Trujillonella humicola TaxID=3383699 RepID=UPI0039057B0B
MSPERLLGGGLLFCDPRFHDLNAVPADRRWRYEHRREGRLVGVVEGVVNDGVLLSGHSAPFGGPDLVRADPPIEDLLELVGGALEAARADGLSGVRVRSRPPVYSPAEPVLEYVLLNSGFTVEHCDVNQHVDLAPLHAGVDPLSLFKRKRPYVRTALAGPHELVEVSGGEDLTTLHRILDANRAAHGRPPGLPRDYLERVRAAFPDRVWLLLLRVDGQAVAAAVVYRVLDDVDLLVAWGDAGHELERSPMDLLAHLLVKRSLQGGVRLFDLGPSSEKDGTPNTGLVNFKRSVGAAAGTRKVLLASFRERGNSSEVVPGSGHGSGSGA